MSRETDLSEETRPDVAPEDLEDLALDEDYALTSEFVDMVIDAADRGDGARLAELVGALHPADVADLMGFLSADDREELVPHLDPEILGEVLTELDDEIREEILEHVPSQVLAKALGEMESDDAADVVDDLEDDKRAQVLAAMPEVERAAIETTLAYEDETAGRLMQREVVAAPQFWTVGQTIDHLRRESEELPELFFDVYVVDPAYKPVGACPVSHLLRSQRDIPLAQIMEQVTEIPVDMDQEEVAYIFDKYRLISAPVIEPGGGWWARSPSTTSSASSRKRARRTSWPWPASPTPAATPPSWVCRSRACRGW
jgi:magnesium transporter